MRNKIFNLFIIFCLLSNQSLAFQENYTLAVPSFFYTSPDGGGAAASGDRDVFIEHTLAAALGRQADLDTFQLRNIISEIFQSAGPVEASRPFAGCIWKEAFMERGSIVVPLGGERYGERRIFSRALPADKHDGVRVYYSEDGFVWRWDEQDTAIDKQILDALEAAGYEELLDMKRRSEELAFLECRRILEDELSVYDDNGEFTGLFNACVPDTAKFREEFPGMDMRREARNGLMKGIDRYNFARNDNLLNYILSWVRDDIVNTWFYFLDWRFSRDAGSRDRCAKTYRALLDFYQSEEQMEKIDLAIAKYSETGIRGDWRDNSLCIDPRLNPINKKGIPQDRGVALQLDAVGLLLFMLGAIAEENAFEMEDRDIEFIQKLTGQGGYLDSMEWEDYGIWEEGVNGLDEYGRDRRYLAEKHTSSIALLALGLKKVRNVFGREVRVDESNIERAEKEVSDRLGSLAEGGNFESDTRKICFGILFSLVLNRMASPGERIFNEEQEKAILEQVLTLEDKQYEKGLIRYKGDTYNSWNDGERDREAPWPFGYGLLSLYHGLAALEEGPGGRHLEEADKYRARLNAAMTERGIPESFNGDEPIVLNPLGYPMAAFMSSKLVGDRLKARKLTEVRGKALSEAMNERYRGLAYEKIRGMSYERSRSAKDITLPDIDEFAVLLDSEYKEERTAAQGMLGRYINSLDTFGLLAFMREIFDVPNLSQNFPERFNWVRETSVDYLAFILSVARDTEGLKSIKETLDHFAGQNKNNPAFISMLTDAMLKEARREGPPVRADFPASVFYGVHTRHFTGSGTIKEAAGKLKELRDLGVTDIVLAPPIFQKSLLNRKRPEGGRLSASEQVKLRENDQRFGSLHSVRDFRSVDPEFGDMDDLVDFVSIANAYGIRVYMDWVSLNIGADNVNYPVEFHSDSKAWEMYWDVDGLAYEDPEKYNRILSINADLCVKTILMGFSGLRMDATCDVALAVYKGLTGRDHDWWEKTEEVLEKVPQDHPSRTIWHDFRELVRKGLASELEKRRVTGNNPDIGKDARDSIEFMIIKYTGRDHFNAFDEKISSEEIILPNLLDEEQWHNRSVEPVKSGNFDLIIGWPAYLDRDLSGSGTKGLRFAFSEGQCELDAFFRYLEKENEIFAIRHDVLGRETRFLRIGETHDQADAADVKGGDNYISRFAKLVGKERLRAFYSFIWALGGPPFINTHQEFGDDRLLEQFAYVPYHLPQDDFSLGVREHIRKLNHLKRISKDLQTADFERVDLHDAALNGSIAAMKKGDTLILANLSNTEYQNITVDLSILGSYEHASVYDLITGQKWDLGSENETKNFSVTLGVGESMYLRLCPIGEEPAELKALQEIEKAEPHDAMSLFEHLTGEVLELDWAGKMDLVMNSRDRELTFITGIPDVKDRHSGNWKDVAGITAKRIKQLIASADPVKMSMAVDYFNIYVRKRPQEARISLSLMAGDDETISYLFPRIDQKGLEIIFVIPENIDSVGAGGTALRDGFIALDSALAGWLERDGGKERPFTSSIHLAMKEDLPVEQMMLAAPKTLAQLALNVTLSDFKQHQLSPMAKNRMNGRFNTIAELLRKRAGGDLAFGFASALVSVISRERALLLTRPSGDIEDLISVAVNIAPANRREKIITDLFSIFGREGHFFEHIVLEVLKILEGSRAWLSVKEEGGNDIGEALRSGVDGFFESELTPDIGREKLWFTKMILEGKVNAVFLSILDKHLNRKMLENMMKALRDGDESVLVLAAEFLRFDNVLEWFEVVEYNVALRQYRDALGMEINRLLAGDADNDYSFSKTLLGSDMTLYEIDQMFPGNIEALKANVLALEEIENKDLLSSMARKVLRADIPSEHSRSDLHKKEMFSQETHAKISSFIRYCFENERTERPYRPKFWFTRMLLNENISLNELIRLCPEAIDVLAGNIRQIAFEENEKRGDGPSDVFDYSREFSLNTDHETNLCSHWEDPEKPSERVRTRFGNGIELSMRPLSLSREGVVFEVYAPEAKGVSVAGDFFKAIAKKGHDWGYDRDQFAMVKGEDGYWYITIPLEPSADTYFYKIYVADDKGDDFIVPSTGEPFFKLDVRKINAPIPGVTGSEDAGVYVPGQPDVPAWSKKGVRIYELFPRFFDNFGDPEHRKEGIRKFAKHMEDEGFTAVWLAPTHPEGYIGRKGDPGSPYAIRDHFEFNIGNENMDFLRDELEKRGIKLIFDIVMNHTAPDHIMRRSLGDDMWVRINGNLIPPMADWYDIAQLNHLNLRTQNYFLVYMAWLISRYGASGFRCDVGEFAPISLWHRLFSTLGAFREWNHPESTDKGLIRILEGGKEFGQYDAPEYFGEGRFNCGYGMALKDRVERNSGVMGMVEVIKEMESSGYLWLAQWDNHDINWYFGTMTERFRASSDGKSKTTVKSMVFIREDQNPEVFIPMEWMGDEVLYPYREDHHNKHKIDFSAGDPEYNAWYRRLVGYERGIVDFKISARKEFLEDLIRESKDQRLYASARELGDRRIVSLANTGFEALRVTVESVFPGGIGEGEFLRDNITGDILVPGEGVLTEDSGYIFVDTERPMALEKIKVSEVSLDLSDGMISFEYDDNRVSAKRTVQVLKGMDPVRFSFSGWINAVCALVRPFAERFVTAGYLETRDAIDGFTGGVKPLAMILYADDIVSNLGFYDIKETLSEVNIHGKRIFEGNTLVVYGGKENIEFIRRLVSESDPSINLIVIDKSEMEKKGISFGENEAEELAQVVKMSRRSAFKELNVKNEFVGIIKGGTPDALKLQKISSSKEVDMPIVVYGGGYGIYSFKTALFETLTRKIRGDKARWFCYLSPAIAISRDLAEKHHQAILEKRTIETQL